MKTRREARGKRRITAGERLEARGERAKREGPGGGYDLRVFSREERRTQKTCRDGTRAKHAARATLNRDQTPSAGLFSAFLCAFASSRQTSRPPYPLAPRPSPLA